MTLGNYYTELMQGGMPDSAKANPEAQSEYLHTSTC